MPAVIITGATGFIGKTLCSALHRSGIEVIPFGRKELQSLEYLQTSLRLAEKSAPVTHFIHLAHDFAHNDENVEITKRILEGLYGTQTVPADTQSESDEGKAANKKTNKLTFIFMSSWVVLHNLEKDDEYTTSKKASEALVKASAEQHQFPYAIVRPAIVVGPGSPFKPRFMTLLRGLCQVLYVNHVQEVVCAIHKALYSDLNQQTDRDNIIYPSAHKYEKGKIQFISRWLKSYIPSAFWFLNEDNIGYPQHRTDQPVDISANSFANGTRKELMKLDGKVSFSALIRNEVQTISDVKWAAQFLPIYRPFGQTYTQKFFGTDPMLTPNPDAIPLYLKGFDSIINYDSNTYEIVVQSGCTMSSMLTFLEKHGRTIRNIPEFADMSAAACITTQVHGTSLQHATSCTASDILEYDGYGAKSGVDGGSGVQYFALKKGDPQFQQHFFHPTPFIISTVKFQTIACNDYQRTYWYHSVAPGSNWIDTFEQKLFKLPQSELDGITFTWNPATPDEIIEWNNKPANYSQKGKIKSPSHLLRRHEARSCTIAKRKCKAQVIERGSYTEISNQFHWFQGEQLFMLGLIQFLRKRGNDLRNMEIYCPISQFRKMVDKLDKNKIKSVGIRFTAQDELIKFEDAPNDLICWMDLVYNGPITASGIQTFHTGKYHIS